LETYRSAFAVEIVVDIVTRTVKVGKGRLIIAQEHVFTAHPHRLSHASEVARHEARQF
jgi:hypothetical protein